MYMQRSLYLLETKSSAASTRKTVSEKTATIAVEGTSAETSHQHQLCKLHLQYIDRLHDDNINFYCPIQLAPISDVL